MWCCSTLKASCVSFSCQPFQCVLFNSISVEPNPVHEFRILSFYGFGMIMNLGFSMVSLEGFKILFFWMYAWDWSVWSSKFWLAFLEGFKIVWCSGFVGSNEFEFWPVKYYEGVCSLLFMFGFDPTLNSTGCLKTE